MYKPREEKKEIRSEIFEKCVVGGMCEGICRDLYYGKACKAALKFYIDYSDKKPTRVFLPTIEIQEEKRKK
jgi:hypothetical protein